MVNVTIEYCGSWGYEPRMKELRSAIKEAVPSAQVEDNVGRRSSFEVTVDGTVIHSKLATMNFPDIQETVTIIQGVEAGQEPKKVEKMAEGGGCTIL